MGSALARHLNQAGYKITACIDKRTARSRDLANELTIPDCFYSLQKIGEETQVALIAVPDAEIANIDRSINKSPSSSSFHYCIHTSGALPASILENSSGNGIAVGSMHPLQTFTSVDKSPSLKGAYFAIEGDSKAVELMEEVILQMGGIPVKLPPEGKSQYHAAAVFASNFIPVLLREALLLLSSLDVPPTLGRKMLRPLMETSLNNCLNSGEIQALTGPVVRGDAETVKCHLEVLSETDPSTEPLYRILTIKALELAIEKGLEKEKVDSILNVLDDQD
ncbi:hypothetical protein CEE37_12460 [candidate division LCP-89 bacterium B3_LCP]|uniref:DUF2520 domain-containing protein n=1 Tax=candidate division LCP-89 bacterium B3_LCP TaxID=2012998 RepID=A0A532UUF1_UNCL8|nr:MAG: hypothetical protein CEE37_12460 [candidate division LCP-89 bacterium B3_LCP]